jgi:hypothetical protein
VAPHQVQRLVPMNVARQTFGSVKSEQVEVLHWECVDAVAGTQVQLTFETVLQTASES